MVETNRAPLPARAQLLSGEVPDRLEHPEAWLRVAPHPLGHEAAVDQVFQTVEDPVGIVSRECLCPLK